MVTRSVCGFQRLAVVTTALTLALVALGGAVRATNSGLACPDWPRCFGAWIPPADLHMWLEHSHRLLAGVVGTAIAAITLWALARFRDRRSVLWPSVAALVLVVAQAGLGALVVLRLLAAELVTAHLGMAMVVIGCLVYLAVTVTRPPADRAETRSHDLRFAGVAAGVAALAFVQILVGGHVTGIAAGLVYTDFPLMDGALLPAVSTEREAFHVAHRLLAYLLAGGVVYLYVAAVRHRAARQAAGTWAREHRWLVWLPAGAIGLVAVQIALGVANLFNGTSFVTVIPHLAVASWIWTALVALAVLARRLAPAAAPTGDRAPVRERAPA